MASGDSSARGMHPRAQQEVNEVLQQMDMIRAPKTIDHEKGRHDEACHVEGS